MRQIHVADGDCKMILNNLSLKHKQFPKTPLPFPFQDEMIIQLDIHIFQPERLVEQTFCVQLIEAFSKKKKISYKNMYSKL